MTEIPKLESQCVNGDIVSDMLTHQELQCLQCHADLTKQGHEWSCSHHPTAPVCPECGENLRANGHKGTCSQSVMQGGSPMPSLPIKGSLSAPLVTLTVVKRAKWWKRPWLWLLGKPTRWTFTYTGMRFTGFTLNEDGSMRADFTSGAKP